ncbi:response regulator transcription factor [Pseudonocardia sp.]|uniref:LuxR C-terminal-related transcriptional regulator n=1 Tax=Pseudonocardia sp. TaxID=60912 RepID=UPI002623D10A|nr:response regulator transcription factor [Pseudonocardia sp.]
MTAPEPVTALLVHGPADRASALDAAGIGVQAAVDSAQDAVAAVASGRPDVVVVDLAGGDALAAIALVADEQPGTAVLAISVSAEHADVLAAVRAGATGYVVATAEPSEVVDAVRRLARGESAYSPGLAVVVLEARGEPAAPEVHLTDRELDVLRLVVEGLTARQIATRLVISPRTVENHVQHLMGKLPVTNRAALVRYAIENGLA